MYPGFKSYISNTVCDELVSLMSKTVLLQIVLEGTDAKYFALIVDSTPDVSHVNQLSIFVRFVTSYGNQRGDSLV